MHELTIPTKYSTSKCNGCQCTGGHWTAFVVSCWDQLTMSSFYAHAHAPCRPICWNSVASHSFVTVLPVRRDRACTWSAHSPVQRPASGQTTLLWPLLSLIHHPEFLFALPFGTGLRCRLGLGLCRWLRLRLRLGSGWAGGRLQAVLMQPPPPQLSAKTCGGWSAGGLGGGLLAARPGGGGGGLRATHNYHMHTSRGCVCLGAWGERGMYAIIAISRLCREESLKGLKDQTHSTPFDEAWTKNLAPLAP